MLQNYKPCFQQAIGNGCAATMNNEPRTNNQCEGHNNRFACLIGHTHPDIWKFIDTIKCEVCYVSAVIRMNDCIKICTDPVERSWPDTTRNCRDGTFTFCVKKPEALCCSGYWRFATLYRYRFQSSPPAIFSVAKRNKRDVWQQKCIQQRVQAIGR